MKDSTTDRELLELAAKHEKRCRTVAHIIGPSSAAQRALNELDMVRAMGEQAAVVEYRGAWIVVRAAAENGRSHHA